MFITIKKFLFLSIAYLTIYESTRYRYVVIFRCPFWIIWLVFYVCLFYYRIVTFSKRTQCLNSYQKFITFWNVLVIYVTFSFDFQKMSEALIFASTNPQYDDRLFIELQVQYMKIPSSNQGRTCCVQKLFLTFRTILS